MSGRASEGQQRERQLPVFKPSCANDPEQSDSPPCMAAQLQRVAGANACGERPLKTTTLHQIHPPASPSPPTGNASAHGHGVVGQGDRAHASGRLVASVLGDRPEQSVESDHCYGGGFAAAAGQMANESVDETRECDGEASIAAAPDPNASGICLHDEEVIDSVSSYNAMHSAETVVASEQVHQTQAHHGDATQPPICGPVPATNGDGRSGSPMVAARGSGTPLGSRGTAARTLALGQQQSPQKAPTPAARLVTIHGKVYLQQAAGVSQQAHGQSGRAGGNGRQFVGTVQHGDGSMGKIYVVRPAQGAPVRSRLSSLVGGAHQQQHSMHGKEVAAVPQYQQVQQQSTPGKLSYSVVGSRPVTTLHSGSQMDLASQSRAAAAISAGGSRRPPIYPPAPQRPDSGRPMSSAASDDSNGLASKATVSTGSGGLAHKMHMANALAGPGHNQRATTLGPTQQQPPTTTVIVGGDDDATGGVAHSQHQKAIAKGYSILDTVGQGLCARTFGWVPKSHEERLNEQRLKLMERQERESSTLECTAAAATLATMCAFGDAATAAGPVQQQTHQQQHQSGMQQSHSQAYIDGATSGVDQQVPQAVHPSGMSLPQPAVTLTRQGKPGVSGTGVFLPHHQQVQHYQQQPVYRQQQQHGFQTQPQIVGPYQHAHAAGRAANAHMQTQPDPHATAARVRPWNGKRGTTAASGHVQQHRVQMFMPSVGHIAGRGKGRGRGRGRPSNAWLQSQSQLMMQQQSHMQQQPPQSHMQQQQPQSHMQQQQQQRQSSGQPISNVVDAVAHGGAAGSEKVLFGGDVAATAATAAAFPDQVEQAAVVGAADANAGGLSAMSQAAAIAADLSQSLYMAAAPRYAGGPDPITNVGQMHQVHPSQQSTQPPHQHTGYQYHSQVPSTSEFPHSHTLLHGTVPPADLTPSPVKAACVATNMRSQDSELMALGSQSAMEHNVFDRQLEFKQEVLPAAVPLPSPPARASLRTSSPRVAVKYPSPIPSVSQPPPASSSSESDSGSDSEESRYSDWANGDYTTRCICGMQHNDDFMIQCDKCEVWQHCQCMGIGDRRKVPKAYLCERCDASVRLKYTPVQAAAMQMRKLDRRNKQKEASRRRREQRRLKKKQRHDERRKAQQKRLEQIEASARNFTPIRENEYSADAARFLRAQSDTTGADLLRQVPSTPVCKGMFVDAATMGMVTLLSIPGNQPIAEYLGHVCLRSECSGRDKVGRPLAHTMLYSGFYSSVMDGGGSTTLCIDARLKGSELRFARRSCRPNTTLKAVVREGQLHLLVISACVLERGTELTVPFDQNWSEARVPLQCACKRGRDAATDFGETQNESDFCMIREFNKQLVSKQAAVAQQRREQRNRIKDAERVKRAAEKAESTQQIQAAAAAVQRARDRRHAVNQKKAAAAAKTSLKSKTIVQSQSRAKGRALIKLKAKKKTPIKSREASKKKSTAASISTDSKQLKRRTRSLSSASSAGAAPPPAKSAKLEPIVPASRSRRKSSTRLGSVESPPAAGAASNKVPKALREIADTWNPLPGVAPKVEEQPPAPGAALLSPKKEEPVEVIDNSHLSREERKAQALEKQFERMEEMRRRREQRQKEKEAAAKLKRSSSKKVAGKAKKAPSPTKKAAPASAAKKAAPVSRSTRRRTDSPGKHAVDLHQSDTEGSGQEDVKEKDATPKSTRSTAGSNGAKASPAKSPEPGAMSPTRRSARRASTSASGSGAAATQKDNANAASEGSKDASRKSSNAVEADCVDGQAEKIVQHGSVDEPAPAASKKRWLRQAMSEHDEYSAAPTPSQSVPSSSATPAAMDASVLNHLLSQPGAASVHPEDPSSPAPSTPTVISAPLKKRRVVSGEGTSPPPPFGAPGAVGQVPNDVCAKVEQISAPCTSKNEDVAPSEPAPPVRRKKVTLDEYKKRKGRSGANGSDSNAAPGTATCSTPSTPSVGNTSTGFIPPLHQQQNVGAHHASLGGVPDPRQIRAAKSTTTLEELRKRICSDGEVKEPDVPLADAITTNGERVSTAAAPYSSSLSVDSSGPQPVPPPEPRPHAHDAVAAPAERPRPSLSERLKRQFGHIVIAEQSCSSDTGQRGQSSTSPPPPQIATQPPDALETLSSYLGLDRISAPPPPPPPTSTGPPRQDFDPQSAVEQWDLATRAPQQMVATGDSQHLQGIPLPQRPGTQHPPANAPYRSSQW